MKIINTGRTYTAAGQLIAFEQQPDGTVYFNDVSRGISGQMKLTPQAGKAPDAYWLMTLYDLGNAYEYPRDHTAFADFTRRAHIEIKAGNVEKYWTGP